MQNFKFKLLYYKIYEFGDLLTEYFLQDFILMTL